LPSLTEIVMPLLVPAAVGVPASLPVDVLKVAHEGLLAILNVSASPFGSFAVGVNAYAGHVTNAGVAEAHRLPFTELGDLVDGLT